MINIIETNKKSQISQQVESTQVVEKPRIYKRSIINNYDGDYNGCLKDIHKRIIGKIGTLSYLYPHWQRFPINLTQCISLAKKWSDSIQKRIDFSDKIVVIFFVMTKRIIQIEVKARITDIENNIKSDNIQSQMNLQIEPKIEQKIEPKIEQKIEPKIEQKIEPKIEQKIEPKIEQKIEQNIDMKFESKIDMKFESKIDMKFESKIEKKINELVQEIRNEITQQFKNEFEQEFKKMFELEIMNLKNEFKQEIASLKNEFKLSILKNLKEILHKETNNFKPIKPIKLIKPIETTNSIEIIMNNNKIDISEKNIQSKNIQSTNINNYSRYSNNNYGFRGKVYLKANSPYKDALLKKMQNNEENL
jgi:hypothetical protein